MSKRRVQRRETRISLVVGAVLALLIAVGGGVAAMMVKTVHTAESVIVVLPSPALDAAGAAAYYETLSRGQIVATFAEVAHNLRFEQQAEEKLGLNEAQRATVKTTVSVVPDTSVILVRASAEEATVAEQVADGVTSSATAYLASLSKPYRTEVVHRAQGSSYVSSTPPLLLAGAALVVALAVGLAVQQAVYHLLIAARRGSKHEAAPGVPLGAAITVNGGGPHTAQHETIPR